MLKPFLLTFSAHEAALTHVLYVYSVVPDFLFNSSICLLACFIFTKDKTNLSASLFFDANIKILSQIHHQDIYYVIRILSPNFYTNNINQRYFTVIFLAILKGDPNCSHGLAHPRRPKNRYSGRMKSTRAQSDSISFARPVPSSPQGCRNAVI